MLFRALRSIFNYYREVDEDASASVICLAIIHDLGRNHHERSCMIRAIEDCQVSVSETSKPASFLSIIDHGRALFKAEAKECGNDDMTYHFLRLVHSYHRKCSKEGKYLLAQEFMEHELRLRKDEEDRQVEQVKSKHSHDRQQLAMAHTRQAEEFQQCECPELSKFCWIMLPPPQHITNFNAKYHSLGCILERLRSQVAGAHQRDE